MAPKSRAKAKRAKKAKAGAKDPNTPEGHCGASERSQDTKPALQETAPLASTEPVNRRESAEVPSWNGRRYRRRGGRPTEDEQEVAEFLASQDYHDRWESEVTATIIMQLKNDPDYSPPVQK